MTQIIGQTVGILAVACFFISFQFNTKKGILVSQTAAVALFSLHYFLIGATAGMLLNIVSIIRNVIYYHRDKKYLSSKVIPFVIATVVTVLGLLSWQGWHTLLFTAGLVINNFFLAFGTPNGLRKSILVSSPMILIYNAAVFSVGGIINELFCIISSVIGMVRYRKK